MFLLLRRLGEDDNISILILAVDGEADTLGWAS